MRGVPVSGLQRFRVPEPRRCNKKGDVVAGAADKAKGRVKKAIGELTDSEALKREGDIDKATGKVKEATQKIADKARGVARKK